MKTPIDINKLESCGNHRYHAKRQGKRLSQAAKANGKKNIPRSSVASHLPLTARLGARYARQIEA
jgi:hypothetical protein